MVSRAGLVFATEKTGISLKGCGYDDYPLKEICIVYNGDVILCCMDWKREIVIGSLNNNTISEIWNSGTFEKIRDMIYGKVLPERSLLCNCCEKAVR